MTEVADFTRWLHAVANRLIGPYDPLHDDLVNEGAIAMWQAFERNEETDPGKRIAYAIKCAESRMKDFAWGGRPATGHVPMRGSRPAEQVTVLDALTDEVRESIAPIARDIAEAAAMAYHHGQIHDALQVLSPAQRAAAYAVMADAPLTKNQHNQWYKARERLAAELAHLAC